MRVPELIGDNDVVSSNPKDRVLFFRNIVPEKSVSLKIILKDAEAQNLISVYFILDFYVQQMLDHFKCPI